MHKQIIDYFENLNTNLKDFPEKSFFRMDLMEITGSFRTGINFPAMTVESPDLDGSESSVHNSVIGRMFAFTVYVSPQNGNFAQLNEQMDLAEKIAWKVIARMRHDARDPEHFLYNRFLVSSVRGHKVGPVFNELLHGYRMTGLITGSESLKVDAADWDDIDLTC